jgi:hypothetical protein
VPTSQAITFEQRALRTAETAIGLPLGPDITMMAFRSIEQQVAAVWRFVESEIRGLLVVTQLASLLAAAATSTPGEAVIRIEGILRVNIARLITGSPGKMEV